MIYMFYTVKSDVLQLAQRTVNPRNQKPETRNLKTNFKRKENHDELK